MADSAFSPKFIYKYDHKLWWLQEAGALKMISICTTTIALFFLSDTVNEPSINLDMELFVGCKLNSLMLCVGIWLDTVPHIEQSYSTLAIEEKSYFLMDVISSVLTPSSTKLYCVPSCNISKKMEKHSCASCCCLPSMMI